MPRPRIGITTATGADEVRLGRYIDYVTSAGGEPVVLRPADARPLADLDLDGLLLTGGVDVHPNRYGRTIDQAVAETLTIDEERDAFELPLALDAIDAGLPVLGICRGMQLLNVVQGGTLVQHLDGHTNAGSTPQPPAAKHQIRVAGEGHLRTILGGEHIGVNSWHHQAVRDVDLAPGVRATAWSPDGVIEAIERADHRWVIGVQWHPERVNEVDPANGEIARAFVAKAAERPSARRAPRPNSLE